MSLVLNTNTSGGGAYITANYLLNAYPDFENSVLVFFPGEVTAPNSNAQITDWTVIKTVGGTPINGFSGICETPEHFVATSERGLGAITLPSGNSNATYRVAINSPLVGGEIVGKNMIGGVARIGNGGYGSSNAYNISMTVKLLHTDGTLTQVGVVSWAENRGRQDSGYYLLAYGSNLQTYSGSGVVASAGDLIVVDYYVQKIYNSSSNPNTTQIKFGYKYTSSDSSRLNPLQISID